jgi:hypothetical protein
MKRFSIDPATLPTTWRVGRRVGNSGLEHAFDLRRRDDGGISISNVEHPLTETERTMLLSHFGKARVVTIGGEADNGALVTTMQRHEPGEIENFVEAVYSLPSPFMVMPNARRET